MCRKNIKFTIFLSLIGLLSLILINSSDINNFNLMAFPTKNLMDSIRFFSNKGSIQNILAISMYVFIGLSPIYLLNLRLKKRKFIFSDLLLIILSFILFISFYMGLKTNTFEKSLFNNMYYIILNIIILNILLFYLILEYLHFIEDLKSKNFSKELKYGLYTINSILIISIFIVTFPYYYKSLQEITLNSPLSLENSSMITDNTLIDNVDHLYQKDELATSMFKDKFNDAIKSKSLNISYINLSINFINKVLPNLVAIWVSFLLIDILDDKIKDNPLDKIIKISSVGLKVIVVFSLLTNILNYFLIGKVYNTNFSLRIPFAIVIYLTFIMSITSYLKRNRELEKDNSLFI